MKKKSRQQWEGSPWVVAMAEMVRQLVDAGKCPPLPTRLWHVLYRVAKGATLPEVVIKFADKAKLLARVGWLPLADQEKIIQGEPLDVVVMGPDGEHSVQKILAEDLTQEQISYVFSRGTAKTPSKKNEKAKPWRAGGVGLNGKRTREAVS